MGKGEKVGRSGEEGSVDSSRGGSDQRFLYFNHTINRHRSGSIQGYGRRRRPCQHIFHPPVYARPPAIQLSLHLAESLEISLISRRSILRFIQLGNGSRSKMEFNHCKKTMKILFQSSTAYIWRSQRGIVMVQFSCLDAMHLPMQAGFITLANLNVKRRI